MREIWIGTVARGRTTRVDHHHRDLRPATDRGPCDHVIVNWKWP